MPGSVEKFRGSPEELKQGPQYISPDQKFGREIKEIFSGAELCLLSSLERKGHKNEITEFLNEFKDKKEKYIFGKDTFIKFLDYMAENAPTLDLECLVFPYLELFNGLDDEIIEKVVGIGKDKDLNLGWECHDGEGLMCRLILEYIDCFTRINIRYLFETFEKTSDKHPKLRVNDLFYRGWRNGFTKKICEAGYQAELESRVESRGPEYLKTLKENLQ